MTVLLCNAFQFHGYFFLKYPQYRQNFQFTFEFTEQQIVGWSQVWGGGCGGDTFFWPETRKSKQHYGKECCRAGETNHQRSRTALKYSAFTF